MGKVRQLAEKLLQAEQAPINPYCPYGQRRSQLDDLWPCDQEKYIKMAEAILIETKFSGVDG